MSVMSDWWWFCEQRLAQHWHVTLIRKNIDRKAVSKRERERERAESKDEVTEGQDEQGEKVRQQ